MSLAAPASEQLVPPLWAVAATVAAVFVPCVTVVVVYWWLWRRRRQADAVAAAPARLRYAFEAEACRQGRLWRVELPLLGIDTQAPSLAAAGPLAVELAARVLDVSPREVAVEVKVRENDAG